jgi:hypothetical protein
MKVVSSICSLTHFHIYYHDLLIVCSHHTYNINFLVHHLINKNGLQLLIVVLFNVLLFVADLVYLCKKIISVSI